MLTCCVACELHPRYCLSYQNLYGLTRDHWCQSGSVETTRGDENAGKDGRVVANCELE